MGGEWTRNFVGTRGIEAMVSFDGSVTSTAFPLYDCHGNMVATVARSGSGFNIGNVRTYDVLGGVRSGASMGGPRGRYVANLGHVQDDESGLIYMRARFYEPGSGRFLSEDPAKEGRNWLSYCINDSVNLRDETGRLPQLTTDAEKIIAQLVSTIFANGAIAFSIAAAACVMVRDMLGALTCLQVASAAAAVALSCYSDFHFGAKLFFGILRFMLSSPVIGWMFASVVAGMEEAQKKHTLGTIAVAGHTSYLLLVIGALALDMSGQDL